ncbi:AI-2E family transporter [Marinobacter nanhaiticus D15-8W]|uniref:AI-2E family transporter n=1 Tax=Marinobacter nanhaiticus D15-8W TaxID=626887 RepID=N6WYD0_9GAMM|nr:AI-2E family transporter [Marinobacter nanhaiticus]ENO16606.1 AI-2E family transporter [Marinobacter nanhaiticus D15-8W]BES72404.1 AI-2E family transporter [Marinobacter nanhaiticus D15-8W]
MTETPDNNTDDYNGNNSKEQKGRKLLRQLASSGDLATPLYGIFILGVLYTLYVAHQIILPITLAVLTSLLMAPAVRGARRRWRIPRGVTALVLILGLLAGMAGIGWAVSKPVMKWIEKAPESMSRLLVGGGGGITASLEQVTKSARKVQEQMESLSEGDEPTKVVVQSNSWQQTLFTKVRNGLTGLALALALSYFLLVSGDSLIRNFVRQLPRNDQRMVLRVVRDSQSQIAQYLAVISTSNFLVGLLTGLMCWAVGLPSPAVWGLIAGLARFVPYLGVIGTIGLLAVISATTLDELWMMAVAPLGYLALTSLVGFFIEPYIHGFRMSINPVVIFLSIFFWGWLWGAIGVLMAVPLMTVIQVVLRQIPTLRPIYRVIAR